MMITLQQTFGDNKFPYYKGRANQYQQDELDDNDEDDNGGEDAQTSGETFEALKSLSATICAEISIRPRSSKIYKPYAVI